MRALVITPTPTHPPNQGNRARVLQMAEALSRRGFVVDLLYHALDALEPSSIDDMRRCWASLHIAPLQGFELRRSRSDHWGLDDWVSPAALTLARRLAATRDYDLVLVNYVWCSALFEPFAGSGARLVIDSHDAFGDRHRLSRAAGLEPHWYYTSLAEEGRGFDRADLVIAIQPGEAETFRRQSATPVTTIEYALPSRPVAAVPDGPLKVGYLGSGNPWNVRSVEAFDDLLARRRAEGSLPDAFEFLLFGGVCGRVGDCAVWRKQGPVGEVEAFYDQVDIVLNPMLGGTGLKIKTVEALAFGRLVLSTAAGGAGLEHIHQDLCHPDLDALFARLIAIGSRAQALAEGREMLGRYDTFQRGVEEKIDLMLEGLGLTPARS